VRVQVGNNGSGYDDVGGGEVGTIKVHVSLAGKNIFAHKFWLSGFSAE